MDVQDVLVDEASRANRCAVRTPPGTPRSLAASVAGLSLGAGFVGDYVAAIAFLPAPRRCGAHGELGEAHWRLAGCVKDVIVEHAQRAGGVRVDVELAVVLGGL